MHDESGSTFVRKEPCPSCGSKDNLGRYSDGHAYCFGCGHRERGEGEIEIKEQRRVKNLLPSGEHKPLAKRKISQETCEKFNYTLGELSGQPVQIAHYRDADGHIVAQHVRTKDKSFPWFGDKSKALLFGQHLFRDGGKKVIVTEGEIDCMTVSQAFGNRYPVVSLISGAQGAKNDIKAQYEWLCGYEEVVLFFDMDEPGRKAATECAAMFPPGKAKIVSIPLKDANEMWVTDREKELVSAIFDAKTYRPDGIVNGADIFDQVFAEDDAFRYTYPWQKLQEMTDGFGNGDVIIWTAGSGIGKSAMVREIEWHMLQLGETIGVIRLEESVKRAARDLMGLAINKRLRKKDVWNETSLEDKQRAYAATLGTGRVFLYDHFGSTDIDNIVSRIRYLAVACGCRMVVLDHISIVISGEDEGDERRMLDNLMTKLKTVAMETGVVIQAVCHLKRPSGDKGHEEGAQTSLAQLRGSAAIGQLADLVVGVERDQQDEAFANVNTLRVLKNRYTGETGVAGWLKYDPESGRLVESIDNPFEQPIPQVGAMTDEF
jgi:twinkle protein